jgi:arsenate reductase
MVTVQIFGIKKSQATRAAERFFKERRVPVQKVDLDQKPIAPGEIRRFVDRFTWAGLLDTESKAYADAGLKYIRLSDTETFERVTREPQLLKLPLVRAGKKIVIGHDEEGWRALVS